MNTRTSAASPNQIHIIYLGSIDTIVVNEQGWSP